MLNARQLTALLSLFMTLSGLAACSSDDDGGDGNGGGGSTATGGAATGGAATGGAATGGAATGGGTATGGSGTTTFPADTSSAAILAFLDSEAYKSEPWIGDAAPREAASVTSPHGTVRVFYNPEVAPSIGVADATFAPSSMIVKELIDDAGTVVGKAVNLRATSEGDWTFYCYGPGDRCGAEPADSTKENPTYGQGIGVECGFCHGDTILAPAP